jgi:plastocyanin
MTLKTVIVSSIALLLLVATTSAVSSIALVTMSKIKIISVAVAQQDIIPATPSSSNTYTTFYLFTAEHNGVNTTKTGIEPDTYSPESLMVNKGDIVVIHFYNVDATDRHTFTLGAPYNVNIDLAPGQYSTFTFRADHEGVFGFFCKYHPTMTGHLAVLPTLSAA